MLKYASTVRVKIIIHFFVVLNFNHLEKLLFFGVGNFRVNMFIKVCSNGGAAYITSKLIAKANLNIAIVMQTFENLILQNCSTEFYDVAHI